MSARSPEAAQSSGSAVATYSFHPWKCQEQAFGHGCIQVCMDCGPRPGWLPSSPHLSFVWVSLPGQVTTQTSCGN